jgi:hypothetical protein
MPEVPLNAKWLLLVHQLAPRPTNLRVVVWRRLQHVGAVALRNSLYVLPNTTETREDFEWIKTEITSRGGQVSIFIARAVDGYTDDELEASFRTARTAEYRALIKDVTVLKKRLTGKRLPLSRMAIQRDIARVRERFHTLKATDFFGAAEAGEAQASVERLERMLQPERVAPIETKKLDARFFRRRVWVTRPRPGIDRMASAWLIRRFIAPDAKFAFGSVTNRDQIPFDMPDVEFGHHGSECTYETLVQRFGVSDAAALRIGQLVHDLDLKESRYGVADAPTIGRLVEGLRQAAASDAELLEQGITMIEALYRSFTVDAERSPARRQRQPESKRVRRASKA